MGPVGGCSRKRHTWRCTAARGRALPASRRRRAAHPYPDPNPIRARTLQRQEDGEGPLVDGEDAVERGGEHKRGHHHLVEVHLAVAHGRRRGAGARPLVGRAQLGSHHPLVGLLQVQDACTRARAHQALPSSTRCLLPLFCLATAGDHWAAGARWWRRSPSGAAWGARQARQRRCGREGGGGLTSHARPQLHDAHRVLEEHVQDAVQPALPRPRSAVSLRRRTAAPPRTIGASGKHATGAARLPGRRARWAVRVMQRWPGATHLGREHGGGDGDDDGEVHQRPQRDVHLPRDNWARQHLQGRSQAPPILKPFVKKGFSRRTVETARAGGAPPA